MNDNQKQKLGELIAEMLDLIPNERGLYETNWGNKTAQGIGVSVLNLINEVKGA
jgi:hypothetical protein